MEDKTLEELKQEADVLGIQYMKNIGADKLAAKIEAHYESLSAGDSVKVKADEPVQEEEAATAVLTNGGKLDAEGALRKHVAEQRKNAMKLRVVTITSNDKRDNEYETSVYLSMENQHFAVSKYVPLDIPVELEECLIEVAKSTVMPHHRDEIVDGKRTGNRITVSARKYNVSYEDVKA